MKQWNRVTDVRNDVKLTPIRLLMTKMSWKYWHLIKRFTKQHQSSGEASETGDKLPETSELTIKYYLMWQNVTKPSGACNDEKISLQTTDYATTNATVGCLRIWNIAGSTANEPPCTANTPTGHKSTQRGNCNVHKLLMKCPEWRGIY